MKSLPLLALLLVCAGCADIPELDGSEPKSLKSAAYPRLIPLQEIIETPADPVSEAAEVEQDLTARSEALAKKAQALQNAQTN
ncbi:hypothetical protein [uncultured Ruegeria sp.]|uniref:hypothetical protein n=1 Tax=uncultured Ruegeria sp. TaxID=259304 RepID=UPI0026055530|nr:hypothetical protein [uncultured Ruegeria sp.]